MPSRPQSAILLGLGLALMLAFALASHRLFAQIEGERGIAPLAVSDDIQASGIEVNTPGKTGQEARAAGWKEAYRKAWAQLHGPTAGDGQIESMVTAVAVEHELVGPHRYVAKLTIVFDRSRAGQYLGGGGAVLQRSAPLLVIPVLYSGGTAQVYEVRGPWQKAWAEFRPGSSVISYIRPSGANGESLLITAGQIGRRSRSWWRSVLDPFGASDVVMPIARLERQWPGGPVHGTFTARYGPDSTYLDSFALDAPNEAGVAPMLQQAMLRLDGLFVNALANGLLHPDQTLSNDRPKLDPAIAAMLAASKAADAADKAKAGNDATVAPDAKASPTDKPTAAAISTVTVQFASPDAKAVDSALASLRGVSGVKSAATTSLAIGGTSVMRVSYAGNAEALAAALRGRGWSVSGGGSSLSIKH